MCARHLCELGNLCAATKFAHFQHDQCRAGSLAYLMQICHPVRSRACVCAFFECRAQSIRRKVQFLTATAAAVKKRRKKVEISFKRHPSSSSGQGVRKLRLCYRIWLFLRDSVFRGRNTFSAECVFVRHTNQWHD